jgi:hypothetical protein
VKISSMLLLVLLSISGEASHVSSAQTGSLATGQVELGTYLLHACQASIRVMDSPSASDSDVRNGAFCSGYFHGFGDYNDMNSGSSVCLGGASVGTSIRVYVAYMEKNPKYLDDAMIIGVIYALKDTYPCPTPKN